MEKAVLLAKLKEKKAILEDRLNELNPRLWETQRAAMGSWSIGGMRQGQEQDVETLKILIAQVEEQLKELESYNLKKVKKVCPGCLVTLDFGGGDVKTFRLLKSGGDSDLEILSVDSPLGQVLLGKRRGEEVKIKGPSGSTRAEVNFISG